MPNYYRFVPSGDFSGRERPDACPGALQVHAAADGLLARVRVPGGAVSAAQLREIAACAAELGSGVIELTSRANLQVRGLRSAPPFAARMAGAGLLPSATHERVRNIVASPLSGRGVSGVLDTDPLVAALDRTLRARPRLAGLPGRFLFALDDGTEDVAGLGADVTFAASSGTLLLAGVDVRRTVEPAEAVPLMIAAAEAFLDERAAQGDTAWRIGELEDGSVRVARRLATAGAEGAGGRVDRPRRAGRAGLVEQRNERLALEVVVPLGRLSAAQAPALADAAEAALRPGTAGAVDPEDRSASAEVRLTPWRTVMVRDLTRSRAARLASALSDAGLVTDQESPWVGLSACTGRPGCAKALADVQQDARRWVADRERAAAGTAPVPMHWAGCERRCGRPRGRVVDVVATGDGYRIEHDGVCRTVSDARDIALGEEP